MDAPRGRTLRILSALAAHEPEGRKESRDLVRMLEHARVHPEPCSRHAMPAHFTASALVASPRLDQVLLIHHRKLGAWLQCGGHFETGDASPRDAALREAQEETGLAGLAPHPLHPALLDVDAHPIPPTAEMPEHDHLDLRFLLVADPAAPLAPSTAETQGARWMSLHEAERQVTDPALVRLLHKARRLGPRLVTA